MDTKKFWQSKNFWTNLIMIILGGYLGFTQAMAEDIVGAVFGIIAAGTSLYNFVKDGAFDFKKWITDSNFWNYLAAVVIAIFPMIPGELFSAIENVLVNLIAGNWQAAIIGAITIINVLYKLLKPTLIRSMGGEV